MSSGWWVWTIWLNRLDRPDKQEFDGLVPGIEEMVELIKLPSIEEFKAVYPKPKASELAGLDFDEISEAEGHFVRCLTAHITASSIFV